MMHAAVPVYMPYLRTNIEKGTSIERKEDLRF
jgi:hypothetical protein